MLIDGLTLSQGSIKEVRLPERTTINGRQNNLFVPADKSGVGVISPIVPSTTAYNSTAEHRGNNDPVRLTRHGSSDYSEFEGRLRLTFDRLMNRITCQASGKRQSSSFSNTRFTFELALFYSSVDILGSKAYSWPESKLGEFNFSPSKFPAFSGSKTETHYINVDFEAGFYSLAIYGADQNGNNERPNIGPEIQVEIDGSGKILRALSIGSSPVDFTNIES